MAPVCSTNSASISWAGLERREEATSDARDDEGASRLSDYSYPRGQREKLGVLGGAKQEALNKASKCESFELGQNDRHEWKEWRLRIWRNW